MVFDRYKNGVRMQSILAGILVYTVYIYINIYIFFCRIVNKCLDFYQEDTLPWHKSIEPCLTTLGSTSSDQEVRSGTCKAQHGAMG